MNTERVIWAAVGVVYVAAGFTMLLHRGVRERAIRRGASLHRAVAERAPWLYGPKPMRDWMLDDRTWRVITIFGASLFVVIGLMGIFGVGVE